MCHSLAIRKEGLWNYQDKNLGAKEKNKEENKNQNQATNTTKTQNPKEKTHFQQNKGKYVPWMEKRLGRTEEAAGPEADEHLQH